AAPSWKASSGSSSGKAAPPPAELPAHDSSLSVRGVSGQSPGRVISLPSEASRGEAARPVHHANRAMTAPPARRDRAGNTATADRRRAMTHNDPGTSAGG